MVMTMLCLSKEQQALLSLTRAFPAGNSRRSRRRVAHCSLWVGAAPSYQCRFFLSRVIFGLLILASKVEECLSSCLSLEREVEVIRSAPPNAVRSQPTRHHHLMKRHVDRRTSAFES